MGKIPHIVRVFSNYKRELLELSWVRDSCRELNILLLVSQYTFSLLLFMVNNKNQFQINSEIHNTNNRNNSNLYQQLSHLTIYQKGPFYMDIKICKSSTWNKRCLILLINLNHLWDGFFTNIHFIHWKNISIVTYK